MQPILDFLQANPVQFLATVGLDGKPKVRPFQFMLENGGKLWFCTGGKKDVYAELQWQPWLELSVSSPDNVWLRLAAKAVFADDGAIKNRIVAQNEYAKRSTKTFTPVRFRPSNGEIAYKALQMVRYFVPCRFPFAGWRCLPSLLVREIDVNPSLRVAAWFFALLFQLFVHIVP